MSGLSKVKEASAKHGEATSESGESEDATQKTGDAIAYGVTGSHLSREQKKQAGPLVHYAFGGLMGGAYGAIAEYSRASKLGFGTLFGTALFFGADEIMVLALGLGKPPDQTPVADHLSYWAAHLVYGTTAEAVRRAVRRLF